MKTKNGTDYYERQKARELNHRYDEIRQLRNEGRHVEAAKRMATHTDRLYLARVNRTAGK